MRRAAEGARRRCRPAGLRPWSDCRNPAPLRGFHAVVKRLALVLLLFLALPASAHAAAWKPAGVIARTTHEVLPFAATVDRGGDALFAWSPPGRGLFSRARARRG